MAQRKTQNRYQEKKENLPTIHQANRLILGRQTISLQAKRLLYFMAKRIDGNGASPKYVSASWDEFKEFVQVREPKNWYGRKRIIKKIFENLNENPVEIESTNDDGKKKYTLVNWVQSIELDEDNETLEMYFSDKLVAFLIYLKEQPYTRTIYQIGNYKSTFTIRIKEILEVERWKKQAHLDIPLDKLKWMLGVHEKYPRYSDFRRFVLDVAQKELAQTNSPVQFTYQPTNQHGRVVKRGVQSIRFYPVFIAVQTAAPDKSPQSVANEDNSHQVNQSNQEQEPIDKATAKVYEQLSQWGIVQALVDDFVQNKGLAEIQQAIQFVQEHKNTKNAAGLFIRAMQNGWQTEATRLKVQEKQTQQRLQQIKQLEQEQQNKEQQIKKEYMQRVGQICESILAQNPNMLEVFYNMAKQQLQAAGKKVTMLLEPTAQATYASKLKRYTIIEQIQQTYPEDFEKALQQRDTALKQLREQQERQLERFDNK